MNKFQKAGFLNQAVLKHFFLFVLHADPESIDLQIHYKLLNLIQE